MSSPYISRKTVDSSYRPKGNAMSAGLQRARAPFRFRNALTGISLFAFATGVWAYSMRAVRQDVFDDADEEARALVGSGAKSIEDEERERKAAEAKGDISTIQIPTQSTLPAPMQPAPASAKPVSEETSDRPRGVLAALLDRQFPRLLDPTTKTIVWGAPPVDNVGRMQDALSKLQRK